jgi:hypothetical protein
MELQPQIAKPGEALKMTFRVLAPDSGKLVDRFDIIHEKLFHLFLVSEDLQFFAHEHPEHRQDGSFTFATTLPKPGMYRLLCDFYPSGATPQLIAKSIMLPGRPSRARLQPDLDPKSGRNIKVSLRTEPAPPLAAGKTMLFFEIDPSDGLEPYLGAWGHMLAASADLIDMIHAHPAWEERGPKIQFNVIFPRPGLHRIWVQFQRQGTINTVAFNVPVTAL